MNYLDCLSADIAAAVSGYASDLQEVRIRNRAAVRVKVSGIWYYLTKNSLASESNAALVCADDEASKTVQAACRKSVYAYEKQLVNGFLTLEDGSRFGVAGSMNEDKNGREVCFKTFGSVCIRVPHFVSCVEEKFFSLISRTPGNALVVGGPSKGKTTFLRDLACRLSERQNVLVADERGEISLCRGFKERAKNADVVLWCRKDYCFESAIRALSPDYIICDELTESDTEAVAKAALSGVHVAASIHGESFKDAADRMGDKIKLFDYVTVLGAKTGDKPSLLLKAENYGNYD